MIDHILIVGLGSIGRRHLSVIKKLKPDCLVTVVSRTQKHSKEKLVNFCAKSIKEALFENPIKNKISCALICTPSTEHLKEANELSQQGIHILIEKPISDRLNNAIKLFQIDSLAATIRERDLKVLVGYTLRYHPAAKKFRSFVHGNEIGKIFHVTARCSSYLPDWRPNQDYRRSVSANKNLGGGVLLELSHELDYLRWIFGEMKSVYAELHHSNTLEIDAEESADLILNSEKKIPIILHLDFLKKHAERKIKAFGQLGELEWDLSKQAVSLKRNDNTKSVEFIFDKHYNYNYEEQLKHFFRCVEEKEQPLITLGDARKTLDLIDKAKQSHEKKSRIDL